MLIRNITVGNIAVRTAPSFAAPVAPASSHHRRTFCPAVMNVRGVVEATPRWAVAQYREARRHVRRGATAAHTLSHGVAKGAAS